MVYNKAVVAVFFAFVFFGIAIYGITHKAEAPRPAVGQSSLEHKVEMKQQEMKDLQIK